MASLNLRQTEETTPSGDINMLINQYAELNKSLIDLLKDQLIEEMKYNAEIQNSN